MRGARPHAQRAHALIAVLAAAAVAGRLRIFVVLVLEDHLPGGGDEQRDLLVGEPDSAPRPAVAEPARRPASERVAVPVGRGKSLKDLGTLAKSSVELGAATGTFTPGTSATPSR